MNSRPDLTDAERRRAWRLAFWNIGLWAVGNGLTGSTLIVYLALELDAPKIGLGVGMILAMRHLVGVLRLGAPLMIGRVADRKTFCISTFFASGLLLFCLPMLAAPGVLPSATVSLAALVALWTLHHLLQYLGTIALFSWLADIAPLLIRGRFFGQRERWLVAGEALGAIACGLFSYWWKEIHKAPSHLEWLGYAIPAAIGAWFIALSILPLIKMPRVEMISPNRQPVDWLSILKPFADARFLRLLFFGCWFSLSTGLTQTVQNTYPAKTLGISLLAMLAVQTGMRLGQLSISPALGRTADRLGNKTVMLFCLILTSQGPLFYVFSTPDGPWWFVGAWIFWIAYAGLNIGLPNLMLKLSPGRSSSAYATAGLPGSASNTSSIPGSASNTPYIAVYFTVTGLCYAANTIFGGWLFDQYGRNTFHIFGQSLDYNQWIFLVGWAARSLGILPLLLLIEQKNFAGD